MSTHNTDASTMRTSAGQLVGRVIMSLDCVSVPVVSLRIAAFRLGYSPAHTRLLCDLGLLIGIKLDGRWWVLERSIEVYAPTLRLVSQKAS